MNQELLPFVSIVVPVLNEEHYIAACLTSLLAQGGEWAGGSAFEILVIDGGSTDRTRAIVAAMQDAHPAIRLAHNPKRLQSAAMNLAARIAAPKASMLLRADGHAVYPPEFLATCVTALLRTGAQSVVVPMVTKGDAGFQRAVAAAQNSLIGNGGSAHRHGGLSGFVEHGHHAAFRREAFFSVGGYNETFSHNEDAEYDRRIAEAGGRIWMCGEVTLAYFPRRDPWGLAKQYFFHGAGRARTLLLHHMRPRLRQMLPLVVLLGLVGGLALIPVHPAFALPPLIYGLICLSWGGAAAIRQHDPWLLAIGPVVMIMHLGWALGFSWRCLKLVSLSGTRRGARMRPRGPDHPLLHGSYKPS
jgi:succinoglycan biosynthesis protein ExoA